MHPHFYNKKYLDQAPTPAIAGRYFRQGGINHVIMGIFWAAIVGFLAWGLGLKQARGLPTFFWWFMPLAAFQIIAGAMMLMTAYGIRQRAGWIKALGRSAALITYMDQALFIVGFWLFVFYSRFIWKSLLAIIFGAIISAAFLSIIFLSGWSFHQFLRWFDRLDPGAAEVPSNEPAVVADRPAPDPKTYIHALVNLGEVGFRGILGIVVIVAIILGLLLHNLKPALITAVTLFLGTTVALLFAPKIYYRRQTPFERERQVLADFYGTGMRLLVYADGIEVREYFRAIFIRYDWLEELPDKMGFWDSAIPLRTALPAVPADLQFNGNNMSRVLETIKTRREKYLHEGAAFP